jgi:hypothetical protein
VTRVRSVAGVSLACCQQVVGQVAPGFRVVRLQLDGTAQGHHRIVTSTEGAAGQRVLEMGGGPVGLGKHQRLDHGKRGRGLA